MASSVSEELWPAVLFGKGNIIMYCTHIVHRRNLAGYSIPKSKRLPENPENVALTSVQFDCDCCQIPFEAATTSPWYQSVSTHEQLRVIPRRAAFGKHMGQLVTVHFVMPAAERQTLESMESDILVWAEELVARYPTVVSPAARA